MHVLLSRTLLNFGFSILQGQGYSLAADIQYVDARWKIPVVLPLRDCLSQELNLLCSLDWLVAEKEIVQFLSIFPFFFPFFRYHC